MGTVKVTIAVGDPQGQMFEDLEVGGHWLNLHGSAQRTAP